MCCTTIFGRAALSPPRGNEIHRYGREGDACVRVCGGEGGHQGRRGSPGAISSHACRASTTQYSSGAEKKLAPPVAEPQRQEGPGQKTGQDGQDATMAEEPDTAQDPEHDFEACYTVAVNAAYTITLLTMIHKYDYIAINDA